MEKFCRTKNEGTFTISPEFTVYIAIKK